MSELGKTYKNLYKDVRDAVKVLDNDSRLTRFVVQTEFMDKNEIRNILVDAAEILYDIGEFYG